MWSCFANHRRTLRGRYLPAASQPLSLLSSQDRTSPQPRSMSKSQWKILHISIAVSKQRKYGDDTTTSKLQPFAKSFVPTWSSASKNSAVVYSQCSDCKRRGCTLQPTWLPNTKAETLGLKDIDIHDSIIDIFQHAVDKQGYTYYRTEKKQLPEGSTLDEANETR